MPAWRILLASMLVSGAADAVETPAALDICDGCSSDSHFADRALLVPPPYTTVYVTNRDQTRKFTRWFSQEDFVNGGTRLEVNVVPEAINSVEEGAINDLFDVAELPEITVPRDRIDVPRNSVIGDLQDGRLDTSFLRDLRSYLGDQNFAGDPDSVELGGSIQIGFLTVNLTPKDQVRTRPLLVRVTYPDGSLVELTIGPEIVEWLDASIKDAAGEDIPVEDPGDVFSPVDTDLIEDRELVFNPANPQFIENFLDALRARRNPPGTLECETELTAEGIRLTCTSTP